MPHSWSGSAIPFFGEARNRQLRNILAEHSSGIRVQMTYSFMTSVIYAAYHMASA